jgi:uncharacterized membrane protein
LVKALPLVFSVGADHDNVTLVEDVVAPLDEPLELTGVEATGVEAIGPLPVLVGGVTATTLLLASLPVLALCVEPPHPVSRTTEMTSALSIWAKNPQRRWIIMCIRLANG